MTLDEDTPIIDYLEINGNLTFDPTKDIRLNAKRIFIRDGIMISGSAESPTTFKHEIHLHGEKEDSHLIFDGTLAAGNKALSVTGQLDLYGTKKKSWVKLATNAYPEDYTIFTEDAQEDGVLGWAVGDKIAIATSTFNYQEWEEVEIQSVSIVPIADGDFTTAKARDPAGMGYGVGGAGSASDIKFYSQSFVTKIGLTTALQYYHAGVELADESGKAIDTRAAVGNLSRNVKILGNAGTGTHNANVLVASYVDFNVADPTNPPTREGSVNLNNVEISASGQLESSRGGLRFEKPSGVAANTKTSTVDSCVVYDSDSFGVNMVKTQNVQFKNNIVFKNKQQGIYVTACSDINLENNLVMGTEPRGILARKEEKSSNFFICPETPVGCSGITFTGNYAAGADFVGFMVPAHPCVGSRGVDWGVGNYAQASMVGWRYTNPVSGGCILHDTQVTIFKSNDGAVMSKAGASSVTLKNLALVDNAKALSIVPGAEDGYVEVSDSVIIGRSIHSYCDTSACGSSECAVRRGSLLGGFRQSDESVQLLSKVKIPLDNPKEEQPWNGNFYWNSLSYVNFNPQANCDVKDFAIMTNSNIADKYAHNTFEAITMKNVDMDNSVIFFEKLPESNIVVEKCGYF